MSAGVSVPFSVPCPVADTGTSLGAAFSAGADFSFSLALMNWYSVRAPASALWPSASATLPPTSQASGCRSQKPRTSDTAAPANVAACVASICASGDVDLVPLLGSSTQTTLNQNAIRKRKNMTLPIIPDGFCAAFKLNLADRLEAVVGDEATFLGKIDANTPLILVKFEKIQFA